MLLKKKLLFQIYFILITLLNISDGGKKVNKYNSGLVFYDSVTKQKILPPILTSIKYRNLRFPIIGRYCSCKQGVCNCCAGLNLPQYKFNHNMCSRISLNSGLDLKMEFLMDDVALMMYKISPKNPPPFCMPIPFPVPIPIAMCIQFYNIKLVGYNIHACTDWILKVAGADAMVLHFACMTFGQNGIQLSNPSMSSGSNEQEASDVFDPVALGRRCYI